ncbi:MAG: hypothetical protein U0176_12925 [Bacteroidia bacterium]
MISEKELRLLIDICKAIDRHGVTTFESLQERLGLLDESFIEVLRKLEPGKKAAPSSKKKRNFQKEALDILAKVSEENPSKGQILFSIFENLNAKQSLKSSKQLSFFLSNEGIYQKEVQSREQGIFLIIVYLSKQEFSSLEEFPPKFGELLTPRRDNLQGWSEIIMNRDRPSRK